MPFANSVSTPSQAGRRFHARRSVDGLAYVEFGPDNGAILIDLGEGGLSFQSVMPVSLNQALLFKFNVPGGSNHIDGYAEVAWMNQSGKGGGLRFVELSADAVAQIREWTGVLSAPEAGDLCAFASSDGAGSSPAQESAAGNAPAHSMQESAAPEPIMGGDVPAKFSGAVAARESAQVAGLGIAADEASPDEEEAAGQVSADQGALPRASPIPEFTVEVTAAPDWTAPLASQIEWAAPAAPPIASTHRGSGQPRTIAIPDGPAPYLQNSTLRGSFVRQPRKSAPASVEWDSLPDSQGGELDPQATLASQALKIGVGAAAGACLALALAFGVSSLRTRVQATANAKASASNLADSPAFQLEVADLNNRRWILKSDGEAGSPFSDTPSRQTQLAAAARSESAKSSRSDDSSDSSDAVNTPKSKPPRPSDLALSRPHMAPVPVSSAQIMAPSIFDGITPPIGSVSDRLASGGPDQPGIVPSENQSGVRASLLQSAVLVQRVAPVYPSNALQSRLQGEVLVNATIGPDGVPKDLKIIRGDERLAPAALTAIRQWHYRPATLGGQPIETQIVITINFALK